MKNKFLSEIIIAASLIILLVVLLDPIKLVMADNIQMMIIAFVLIIFIFFAAFVWKEKPRDEREELHNHILSRFAYLSGACVLILGVIYQSFTHTLDPWIVISLIVMILAKIIGSVYTKNK